MIELQGIRKSFRVAKRTSGLLQATKALFHRQYSVYQALDDISFTIQPGEIVGYIGPNGAGKSTSIKVMSGILVPDAGSCTILGYTPWKERTAYVKHIGVVFGQRSQLWWDVPVIDSFDLLRDIYAIPASAYKQTFDLLVEHLDLSTILQQPVRQLSLGQRMRCEIAASLLHNPQVLFLDEPTIGLDAVSKLAVRQFVQTINKERGVTVILTTHDMSDIEALANRILLIGNGRLLYDGSLAQLRQTFGTHKTIRIDFKSVAADLHIPGTSIVAQTERQATLLVDTTSVQVSHVIRELSERCDLLDVSVEARPVEDMIVQMYKEYQI